MFLRNRSHSFLSAIVFSLSCFYTLALHAQTAVPQHPKNAQDINEQNSAVLAVVLGQPVTVKKATPSINDLVQLREDAGDNYNAVLEHIIKVNASTAVIQAVLDDYAKQKNIALNQQWVKQFETKFGREVSDTEQVSTNIEDIAKKQVLLFQTERAMYEEFGGRVIFRQSNPQMPIDAYQALLKRYQVSGKLTFNDSQLESSFWESFAPPFQFEIPAENVDFSTPWWL